MASGMEIFKLWGTIEINKGQAVADIKTVDATAQKSSKNIQSNFGNIAKSFLKVSAIITGAAAAVGTALFALAVKTSNVADEIDKMSIRTGISRERLQELKYVASQTGVEFSTLNTMIPKLAKGMSDAAKGATTKAEAFKKLGVSVKDTNGTLRNSAEVFEEVIGKLAGMENPTQRTVILMQLFEEEGAKLAPMLANGSAGIAELSAKARELGLVMSDDAVAANVKFKDTLDTLKRSVGALFMNLSNSVLPYIQKAVDWTLKNLPKIAAVFTFIGEVVGHTVDYLKDLMGIMVDSFKAGFNGAWDSITDIWSDSNLGFFEKTFATIGKVAGDTVDGIKAGWGDSYETFSDVWDDPNLNFWEKTMATVSKTAKDTIDGLAEGWNDSYFSFKDIWDNPDLNFVEKTAATISKFFKDRIDGIKAGWSDTYDTFKDVWASPDLNFVEKVTASISKFFKDSFDGIVAGAAGSYDTFKEIWNNPDLSFIEKVTATVGKSFHDLFLSLEKGWNDSYATFKAVWSDPDLNFIEKTGISITKFFKDTWDGLKKGWNESYQDLKSVWDNPDLSFVEKAATSLSAGAKITIDWAGDLLSNIKDGDWSAVYDQIKGVGQNITKYLGEGVKGTLNIFTWISEGLTDTTKNLREGAGAVKDVLKDALKAQLSGEDTGADFWETFWDGLVAAGGEIGDWFKDVDLRGIIESAVNLGKSIGEFFKEAFLLVVDFVEIIGLAIANVAVATWNNLLVPAAGWIWDGMKGAFNTLLDLGGVLWDAVQNAATKIWDAGVDIGNRIIDAIKYVFGGFWLFELLGIDTGRQTPPADTSPGRSSGGRTGTGTGTGSRLPFPGLKMNKAYNELEGMYALASFPGTGIEINPSPLSAEVQREIREWLASRDRKSYEEFKADLFKNVIDLGVSGPMTSLELDKAVIQGIAEGIFEPAFVSALAYAESKYKLAAVGGEGYGPFQLEPIAYEQAKKWSDTPMEHTVAATDPVWATEAASNTMKWLGDNFDTLSAALVAWNRGFGNARTWVEGGSKVEDLPNATKILLTNFMLGLEKDLAGDWSKLSESSLEQARELANVVNAIIEQFPDAVKKSFPKETPYTFDLDFENTEAIAEAITEQLPETRIEETPVVESPSLLEILKEIKEAIASKDLLAVATGMDALAAELATLNSTTSSIFSRLGTMRDYLWDIRGGGYSGNSGQTLSGDIEHLGQITQEQSKGIQEEFVKMAKVMVAQTEWSTQEVLRLFTDLYIAIVGASIVPELVRGVGTWMGPGLQKNMVKPTKTATEATEEYFRNLEKSYEKLEAAFKTPWWKGASNTTSVPAFIPDPEDIEEGNDQIAESNKETAEEVVNIWKTAFSDISRMVSDFFVKGPRRILKGEVGIFGAIKELVGNLFGKVEDLFSEAIAEKLNNWMTSRFPQPQFDLGVVGQTTKVPMLTQLVDMGKLLFTQAGGALASGIEALVAATGPVGLVIIAAFTNMTLKLWGFVDKIKRVVTKIDEIFGISQRITEGFENEINPAIEQLTHPFKELGRVIGKALLPVVKALAPVFEWLANGILDIVEKIFEFTNTVIKAINWAFGWLGVKIPLLDMTAFDTELKVPDSPTNAGRQISEITGPTRDILIDLLSPLTSLNSLVGIGNRIAGILDARLPAMGELGLVGSGGDVNIYGDISIQPQTANIDEITQLTAQEIERKISESLNRSRRGSGR